MSYQERRYDRRFDRYDNGGNYNGGRRYHNNDRYYEDDRPHSGRGRSSGNSRYNSRIPDHRNHPDDTLPRAPNMKVRVVYESEPLRKHVTALTMNNETKKVVVCSFDGTVKLLDEQGRGTSIRLDGPIGSILASGDFLIFGYNTWNVRDGVVLIRHSPTKQTQELTGHKGQVLSLLQINDVLLSGGEDASIRLWGFDQGTLQFAPKGVLTKEQDGHVAGVSAMVHVTLPAGGQNALLLISADLSGTIKLWDIANGTCVQTIVKAHDDAVMRMLLYEGTLMTGGMDGHIKVWTFSQNPQPNAVLNPQPVFDHTPMQAQYFGNQQGPPRTNRLPGVLTMQGFSLNGTPMLLVSYNDEVRCLLFNLPAFELKGEVRKVKSVRALAASDDGTIVTGDSFGVVRMLHVNI